MNTSSCVNKDNQKEEISYLGNLFHHKIRCYKETLSVFLILFVVLRDMLYNSTQFNKKFYTTYLTRQ
jgi:hypothetical protein